MPRFNAEKFVDFFKYYDDRNPKHRAAVLELGKKIIECNPDLLADEANWVRVYRTPWPPSPSPTPSLIKLDVPFFHQLDNFTQPHRTCNSSSCAMLLAYKKPGVIRDDDDYLRVVLRYGDTTSHAVQTRALAHFGLRTEFRTNLGFADLDRELQRGNPVVIAIYHRGTLERPTGGHVIICVGKTRTGYLFHDPYGSLLDNYTGPVENGKFVCYSNHILERRWLPDGRGWGRIVLGVD